MPEPTVQIRDYCRACTAVDGKDLPALWPVLALGPIDLSAFPAEGPAARTHPAVPLTLTVCPRCTLVQLRHTTPFSWLFGGQYWYRSGVNEAMQAELADVVSYALGRARLLPGDHAIVADIGANDGTLLAAYHRPGLPRLTLTRLAFEPSSFYAELTQQCERLYGEAFPPAAGILDEFRGKVAVVTAVAMIYDLEDPTAFFTAIRDLLTPDGVCVVQFQDLLQMLQRTAFDGICHEHLEYYSLYALASLLNHVGLWVVDVERRAINGGSLRVLIKRRGSHAPHGGMDRIYAQLKAELDAGLGTAEGVLLACSRLHRRIDAARRQIRSYLAEAIDRGWTVDLYGASTKGNTLLQYFGLGAGVVRQAWERSPEKVGRYVGYTGVPIVAEAVGRAAPPDLLLVPIWQFRDGVIAREQAYLRQGGALLFPLPEAEWVRVAGAGRVGDGMAVA